MEDQDTSLRRVALEKAIIVTAKQPYHLIPQDVVSVAEVFYQFLKGETK
jgi:hypothetical protein